MKRHLSVFFLCCRRSMPGLALLLAGMAGVETLLFTLLRGTSPHTERLFEHAHVGLACGVFFAALCVLLVLPRMDMNGKQGYTIRRLALGRWEVFLWQSLCNSLCFLIFWAFQVAVIFGLFALLKAQNGSGSHQDILLTFYRNDFLHSLLPLRETSRYVRNIFLVAALGVVTAAAPMRMYVGKKGSTVLLVALMATVLCFFSRGIGSFAGDLFLCVVAAVAVIGEVLAILDVMGEGESDEV